MRLKVQDFKKEDLLGVGHRIASFKKPVVVARDARNSSHWIANAVISGILEAGEDALVIGMFPTPGAMYVARASSANAIVVTASHNPPEYNGFKALVDGLPVPRENIKPMELKVSRNSVGDERKRNPSSYFEMLEKEAEKLERERRAIIDYGHGVGSIVSSAFSRKVKHVSLFATPDGEFPIRYPEPRKDTLKIMLRSFKGFEIGFAFDGDADRCVVVDDRGRYVDDHVMLALYASYMADKGPIVTHIGASIIVNKLVEEHGGKVIRTRVGDPYLARKAYEINAAFAGEPNGSRIHPDVHYFPDGPLTMLRVLRMLEELDKPLSELVDEVPKTYVLRDAVERSRSYDEAMECVLSKAPEEYLELVTVDGIRVRVDEFERFLVRPSGTEELIRIRAEAKTIDRAKELLERARKIAMECVRILFPMLSKR